MKKRVNIDKMQYRKNIELSLVLTLFILTLLFSASKRAENAAEIKKVNIVPIETIDIPITVQEERQREPVRHTIPVESEDEDLPEDMTIDFTEINWNLAEIGSPPEFQEEEKEADAFYAYDTAPEIIGGYAELAKNLKYPEIAVKAGVEGKVIVNVKLNENGQVIGTKVIKSLGNNGCDEAAIEAIKAVKWKPAYQRDKAVKVIVAVTVWFKLK